MFFVGQMKGIIKADCLLENAQLAFTCVVYNFAFSYSPSCETPKKQRNINQNGIFMIVCIALQIKRVISNWADND